MKTLGQLWTLYDGTGSDLEVIDKIRYNWHARYQYCLISVIPDPRMAIKQSRDKKVNLRLSNSAMLQSYSRCHLSLTRKTSLLANAARRYVNWKLILRQEHRLANHWAEYETFSFPIRHFRHVS